MKCVGDGIPPLESFTDKVGERVIACRDEKLFKVERVQTKGLFFRRDDDLLNILSDREK